MGVSRYYSHVIWDWNGTLFNDVEHGIKVNNSMLKKRGMKTMDGVADYHKAFCFPIIQYYKNLGYDFDKELFENIAKEYITLYHADKAGGCRLFSGVEHVLATIHANGMTQMVLSASEQNNLLSQMSNFDISGYFDEVLGLSDIYAKSKIQMGLDYLSRKNVERAILIGDTLHDFDVAKALGADCVLIANGHQSRETLHGCANVVVLDDISQVIAYIEKF